MSKYQLGGSQTEYQAGSNDQVLLNKLSISETDEMDEAELVLLQKLYLYVLEKNLPIKALTVAEIKHWHTLWLGNIYEWAGLERSVNMSKSDFSFAAVKTIPKLLQNFETECLSVLTPCADMDKESLVAAIAKVHIEFILIHPFREGNGRLSRLLADVMAVQAGFQPLDYSIWDSHKDFYFASIRQGMLRNYEPMERLVGDVLNRE